MTWHCPHCKRTLPDKVTYRCKRVERCAFCGTVLSLVYGRPAPSHPETELPRDWPEYRLSFRRRHAGAE